MYGSRLLIKKIFVSGFSRLQSILRDDYEEDKKSLISQNITHLGTGMHNCERFHSKNDDNTVNIDIWVDEGPKYYFRNITWVGNTNNIQI